MRSLWAGVSGLQAHQIAMDVEGNNIANVNTTGFKYSRANFSDLLSQTAKIATAPQGELGGKNSMQIGLGTQISSVTKIFKQGSIQTTDKNTDLAIQGDGFFVVSPDGGKTYKYSRNGDFSFDAEGNFVEGNGYIIQGWMKNDTTGQIDSTAPIGNITVPPGLTTPANDTGFITLKANLDSGDNVGTKKSPIYMLDQYTGGYDRNLDNDILDTNEAHNENDSFSNAFNTDNALVERGLDMGALFNANGEAFNLRVGQGVWVSYAEAKSTQTFTPVSILGVAQPQTLDITLNGEVISKQVTTVGDVINEINAKTTITGVQAQLLGTNQIVLVNTNKDGTEDKMKNINLAVTTGAGLTSTIINTAYKYTYSSTFVAQTPSYDTADARQFTTTEDMRQAMQTDARLYVNYDGTTTISSGAWNARTSGNINDGVTVIVNEQGQFQISNPTGDAVNTNDDAVVAGGSTLAVPTAFPTGTSFSAAVTLLVDTTITVSAPAPGGTFTYGPTSGLPIPAGSVLSAPATLPAGTTLGGTSPANDVVINDIVANDKPLYLSITGLTNAIGGIGENTKFSASVGALQGALSSGTAFRTSQSIFAGSHASSIDVYDSLGSKHTVRFEFTKTGYTDKGGTEWSILLSVPEPGKINYSNSGPDNIITGSMSFNSDGSLATFTPTNLTYTANNGSTPNQNIELHFGSIAQFDGMTSFDSDSNTSGISQDGYPGGDLAGIRVDETGTLIGSFTNGRSFGLAQVGMARFTNNEGLESDGGNTFIQTSNSGDPIIGQAAVGGRGFIQASSLEMSNVDLSRSLTQLIVIQRGYQANSKTITTADQLLQTLLQLKQ